MFVLFDNLIGHSLMTDCMIMIPLVISSQFSRNIQLASWTPLALSHYFWRNKCTIFL